MDKFGCTKGVGGQIMSEFRTQMFALRRGGCENLRQPERLDFRYTSAAETRGR